MTIPLEPDRSPSPGSDRATPAPVNPYSVPAYGSTGDVPPGRGASSVGVAADEPFRPVLTLARLAGGAFIAAAVAGVVMFALDMYGLSRFDGWNRPEAKAVPGEVRVLLTYALLDLIMAGLGVIAFILLLVWSYRVTANTRRRVGDRLDVTPGWAIGWWFVPIANLFKPLQMVSQNLRVAEAGNAWRRRDRPEVLGLWWAFWVASTIFGRFASRLDRLDAPPDGLYVIVKALAMILMIGSAVLTHRVLTSVAAKQHRAAG